MVSATHCASTILSELAGNWTLTRDVSGHASLQGMASFTGMTERGLFHYAERGRLRLASGETFESFRNYIFSLRDDGFAVFFDETPRRLFHEIALRSENGILWGEADHLCGDDLYRSRYEFRPDGTFRIQHVVAGPRKAYVSDTVYTRPEP